ncbi:hypothetical protein D3C81_2042540 [compost metagenome]
MTHNDPATTMAIRNTVHAKIAVLPRWPLRGPRCRKNTSCTSNWTIHSVTIISSPARGGNSLPMTAPNEMNVSTSEST